MNNNFCPSRSFARFVAKNSGGKVVDHGASAPSGKRWEVIPGVMVEAIQDTADQRSEMERAPIVTLVIKNENRNRQAKRVSYAHNSTGKPIPVTHRRSKTAALLAYNLERMS